MSDDMAEQGHGEDEKADGEGEISPSGANPAQAEAQAGQANVENSAANNVATSSTNEQPTSTRPSTRPSTRLGEGAGDTAVMSVAKAQPMPPLAPVEKMEVQVDFEVGRVTLPVSALANISDGAVIEVAAISLDRVVAKSGGQAFAHGEFVELGGRIGFRITKLVQGSSAL